MIRLYQYPNEVPEDLRDVAEKLVGRARAFRSERMEQGDRRNVAVFCVPVDGGITHYVTSTSHWDRSSGRHWHSEDRIVEDLRDRGVDASRVAAVFTEWPPCNSGRPTDMLSAVGGAADHDCLETIGSGSSDDDPMDAGPGEADGGRLFPLAYRPHVCRLMLQRKLADGTPVFCGRGPGQY
jgi:Xanthomonas XOO_2897-like deaminase